MSINIIAAISKNRVIGKAGKLPWHISKDLKYFKDKTSGAGNAVLMGFNTWKSLPNYPEPLHDRGSYVITKNNVHLTRANIYKEPPNYTDLKRIQNIYPNIWICGGETIYNHYINKTYIDKIYLTEIDAFIEGDTFFPEIPNNYIKYIGASHQHKLNAINFVNYSFNTYIRKTEGRINEYIF